MTEKNFKLDNLKKLREQKHLTQTRLSIELEVSQELISQYELGTSLPTIQNLLKIADYFNCSTDYILGRTNIATPIKRLSKDDVEATAVSNKFSDLAPAEKRNLISYLDYLSNKKE